MSLHIQIKEEIKQALKAGEKVRLSVLRGLLTAFTNEAVTKGKTAQDEIADDDALTVIKREANKRKDSIEQYTKGGRPELADAEQKELAILETYLPAKMPIEEIEKIARAKKEELGVSDKSKMGILIGAVVKETKGQADGSEVKSIVDKLLS